MGTGSGPGDYFGVSVSVSGDGTRAVVGAFGVSSYRGAAYVFTKTSDTWGSSTDLGKGSQSNGKFGNSVSVSADGATAVVGEQAADIGFSRDAGAAYSFLYA